eukprot:355645-Chlamydomonas_euryale.AAC.19
MSLVNSVLFGSRRHLASHANPRFGTPYSMATPLPVQSGRCHARPPPGPRVRLASIAGPLAAPPPPAHRLERHARTCGRFGEDHGHGLALKRLERLVARVERLLGLQAQVQHVLQLVLAEVVKVQEMLAAQRRRGNHRAAPQTLWRGLGNH